ncbi:hypothetical protein ACFQH6_11820 [Halobacteriaceae archaeon GCM10025711]
MVTFLYGNDRFDSLQPRRTVRRAAYYLPGGPQPSAEPSRVERFLTALFVPPAVHRYRLETRR